jgi:cytochrome c-type biogenesis protein CcmE
MKKLHIIGLVIIAVAIGVILLRSNDYSSYADFDKAREHSSNEYHIVGRLNKSKEQMYNPQIDANKFEFYMVDEKGVESKVVYRGSKPDGFDQTEKIVVAGNYNKDANNFNASQILMKCPSKYVDENKAVNT